MPTRPSGVVASRPHDAKCMPDSCTYKMCPLVVIILYFLTCRYLPYALNYRCCTKLLNVTSTVSKCTYARSCRYKKKYFIKLLTSFLCSAVNCFLASSSWSLPCCRATWTMSLGLLRVSIKLSSWGTAPVDVM